MDKKLLDILVCPVTGEPLEYDKENQRLISKATNLSFEIRDGIPVLIAEEATPYEENSD